MNQTLPLQTDNFVHHVIKRGLFDLNLVSNGGRQFVVMKEDESQSDLSEDCGSGLSTLAFMNFVMASISIAANLLSNSNSNSNNNNNNNVRYSVSTFRVVFITRVMYNFKYYPGNFPSNFG